MMSEDRDAWSAAGYGPAPAAARGAVCVLVACRRWERACALMQALQAAGGQGQPVTGDATSLSRVATCLARAVPDVLLLEHDPADAASRRLLAQVVRLLPASRVLLLCDTCTEQSIAAFVRLGVAGCVESGDPRQLARAICGVHGGECWFPRGVLMRALRTRVAGGASEPAGAHEEQRALTAREREVITLVGSGHTNKEIARLLQISHTTVQTQLHRIYVKLHVSGRYKAYAAFAAQGAAEARTPVS